MTAVRLSWWAKNLDEREIVLNELRLSRVGRRARTASLESSLMGKVVSWHRPGCRSPHPRCCGDFTASSDADACDRRADRNWPAVSLADPRVWLIETLERREAVLQARKLMYLEPPTRLSPHFPRSGPKSARFADSRNIHTIDTDDAQWY